MRMRMKKISPIGRRTGQPIIKKNVRTVYDGTENFDDYWTDSSVESRTENESTFMKKTQRLNESPVKSSRKSNGTSCKRSLSSLSGIADDEISIEEGNSPNLTNSVQSNLHKRRITQKDLSIQTSHTFDTPAVTSVASKLHSSMRKRKSSSATTQPRAVKGKAKRESRNRSFAGEKTWLDKSMNTINLGYEERSIQTSQRNSSLSRQAKQKRVSNIIKENKADSCVEDKIHQTATIENTGRILQERVSDINENSLLRSSLATKKRESRNLTGEKTGINKSINIISLNNKEQSSQVSQRYNSPQRRNGKDYVENRTSQSNTKNDNNSQEVLQEKEVVEGKVSVKSNSLLKGKKKKKCQDVVLHLDSKTQSERPSKNKKSRNESMDDFVTCQGRKEQSINMKEQSKDCTQTKSASNNISKNPANKRKKLVANQESNGQQEEESFNTRKSKRNRIAPLAHWRNERRKFQIRETGNITYVGHDKGSEEDRKPLEMVEKRLKEQQKTLDPLKQHSVNFENINENGVYYKPFDDIKSSKTFHQKDGKEAYIISKVYSDHSSSVGYLQICAGCKKEEQYSPTYNICFTIVKGEVDISLNNTICKLKTKDFLRVPLGVPYSIENPSKSKALIFFTTIKPQSRDETEN